MYLSADDKFDQVGDERTKDSNTSARTVSIRVLGLARADPRVERCEKDIMDACGWSTREMFRRYCIKDEVGLAQRLARAHDEIAAGG